MAKVSKKRQALAHRNNHQTHRGSPGSGDRKKQNSDQHKNSLQPRENFVFVAFGQNRNDKRQRSSAQKKSDFSQKKKKRRGQTAAISIFFCKEKVPARGLGKKDEARNYYFKTFQQKRNRARIGRRKHLGKIRPKEKCRNPNRASSFLRHTKGGSLPSSMWCWGGGGGGGGGWCGWGFVGCCVVFFCCWGGGSKEWG